MRNHCRTILITKMINLGSYDSKVLVSFVIRLFDFRGPAKTVPVQNSPFFGIFCCVILSELI